MKIFLHNFLFIASVISVVIAALLAILTLLGFRPFILDSASMEPVYKKGEIVLADTKVTTDDIRIGDVLIYRAENGTLVMHRLVSENTFRGDANQTSEHVDLDNTNLIGKVCYAINSPVLAFIIENKKISLTLFLAFLILASLPWNSMHFHKKIHPTFPAKHKQE